MTTALENRVRIPLVLADRCDQCGAQAFVRVTIQSSEGLNGSQAEPSALDLLFCGHHYIDHELTFISSAYDVDDQRHRINYRPNEQTEKESQK